VKKWVRNQTELDSIKLKKILELKPEVLSNLKKKRKKVGMGGLEVLLKNKNWPTTLGLLQDQSCKNKRSKVGIYYPRSSLLWP